MGQQQLLLIVLGVIIVGIAVVVGINLFNANAEESAKDTMVSEGTNLGALAQQYYKKPVALGGGGNNFQYFGTAATTTTPGYQVPSNLLNTPTAVWTTPSGGSTAGITLRGTPVTLDYSWHCEVAVTPTAITSKILTGR
jgi:hypothetical protein